MTTMTASNWKPSDAQVTYVKDLFAKRVPADAPNRENFWNNIRSVSSNAALSTVIDTLKAMPLVQAKPVYVAPTPLPKRTDIATEAGLYRDPSDGTLYRLGKRASTWETPSLSVYSNKATVRRLTPEGRMVKKGKWNRLNAYQTRQMLAVSSHVSGPRVLAEWLMTEEDKQTWAVGFCLFCHKGLIDAVSVWNSIGPKCAKDHGIQLEMPPA